VFFGPGNPLAFAALLLFPLLAIAVLANVRGRPAGPVMALVLGGAMFLPEGVAIDPPGLPEFEKEMITYLGVTLGLAVSRGRLLVAARPGFGLEALVFVMILGSFATTANNPDVLVYGPTVLVGMPWYDTATGTLIDLFRYGLPYFLGRAVVRDARDLRTVLHVLAVAGLVYSLLLLTEIRLSPQLHNWVYGFQQNQFAKSVRYGGYRPIAFMDSGIAVGIFMATTLVATAALARSRLPLQLLFVKISARLSSLYLGVVLVLCKSVAAGVEGIALALAMSFASLRGAMRVAVLMAALAICYPAVRIADWMPLEQIVAVSDALDPTRAKSLNFRFESEEAMLAKARERFLFGWGGYRRSWVFDPETGDNVTVPDGYWITQLGGRGLVGFLTAYGLYTIPVFRAGRALRRVRPGLDRTLLVGLALVVAMRGFDQLVNGFYSSYPIFLAGALMQLQWALPRARLRSTPSDTEGEQPAPVEAPAQPRARGLRELLGPHRAARRETPP
jgi:hypothetical protein